MMETIDYLKANLRRQLCETASMIKYQWKAFTVASATILLLWLASYTFQIGWLSYFISLPACVVVMFTALARLNDIGPERMGWVWNIRRIGLIMAGAGAAMVVFAPWSAERLFPTWRGVILVWGFALAWLTTPAHPPFWRYWDGSYRTSTPPRSPLDRLVGRMTRQDWKVADLEMALAENKEDGADIQGELDDKRDAIRRGEGDGP